MLPRLKASIRRAGYRSLRGVVVLRYHRVLDLPADPHATVVSPARFRDQMAVLADRFRPLPLRALGTAGGSSPLPRRGVVVTFDDGYADNLEFALPTLEEFEIPATVFVTSGYVGGAQEFWWDALAAMLLRPGRLPVQLRLALPESDLEFDLGPDAAYAPSDCDRDKSWNWRSASNPTRRHSLFRYLSGALRRLTAGARADILARLEEWSGAPLSARPDHRPLSVDELLTLSRHEFVEIGAHSVSHSSLPDLPADERRREIAGSKQALESLIGAPVISFAYPFGSVGATAALVKEAGFDLGCTTRHGVVFRRGPNYRVPRLFAGDWEAEEFERRVRRVS